MCITDDQANKDVNSFQEAEKRKSDRDNEVEAERKEEVSLDNLEHMRLRAMEEGEVRKFCKENKISIVNKRLTLEETSNNLNR